MTARSAMEGARARPDSARRGARRGWILAGLMCMMMLAAMDTTIVSTVIPQIVGDLGGLGLVSWVFSIYVLAQTVTIPVYGKLSDLFGRKPILVVGTIVFLIGSVASSLSWSMLSLIGFRALQGLGAGAIMATVNTLAGDLYDVEERASVQGWLSSVWGVAAIVGPLLGGALAEYASWRWIFFVNVPVGLAALALLGVFLHESFERHAHRIDYTGAALVLAALGTLIFGLLQGGQAWAWASWQSALVFALTVVFFAALVAAEKRAAEPVMPGWLWRRRVLLGANLATLGMGVVMMAPSVYLPTFLQAVRGQGPIAAGLVLACVSIGWPVASAFSGRIYLRLGFRNTALIGTAVVLLAALAFIVMPRPRPVWLVVLDQVALGAGFGLMSTPLLVGEQSVVGWAQRGVVTGSNMFSRYLGQSLGAALFGAIFNGAISARLAGAPADLRNALPHGVDTVINALGSPATPSAVVLYLRDALAYATGHLYVGMAVIAVLMILAVCIVPRRFALVDERRYSGAKNQGDTRCQQTVVPAQAGTQVTRTVQEKNTGSPPARG